MTRSLKVGLPVLVVALGAIGAIAMIAARPDVPTQMPEVRPPLVRVLQVETQETRLSVRTQGTVTPRTESSLVPEVAGRIVSASPAFVEGGFFEKGEVLITIDPRDYELAVVRARARVAEAELRFEREEEEAAVARREWEELGDGEPTRLVLREPQLAEAGAALAAAKADVERAELDLERTRVRAPYTGRIRQKNVDVGQYVTPGTLVALLYAVDYAEVRLPIPDADLAFLDLPLDYRGSASGKGGPEVILTTSFAGREFRWQGAIVRTEGELDPRSRMVHAVAQVQDPYGRGGEPDRPPLAVGMFVQAEILGRMTEGVVVLPRSALRGRDQVLVVDEEDRLRFRRLVRTCRRRARLHLPAGGGRGRHEGPYFLMQRRRE
jgi:RND family efflux transporter MFP subunit